MTAATATAAPRRKGPQTPEARARVRQNALKHGLRAETLVAEEDKGAVAVKIALWIEQLAPVGDVERTLVERAAIAAVRLKRCARAEQAAMEESAARAARVWEARSRARVRKLAQSLQEEPERVVAELESSAFGIDWLLNKWRALQGTLELRQSQDWNFASNMLMTALTGRDYRAGHPAIAADPVAAPIWRAGLSIIGQQAAWAHLYVAYGGQPAEIPPQGLGWAAFRLLPTREEAQEILRAMIAAELDRLEALRAEVYEAVEAPARAEAIERGLIDTSEEGRRRLRYEQVNERTMHRGLNDLSRRQKDRLKSQESAPGASLWGGGDIEPQAAESGPTLSVAPAPNNTAEAPDSAPSIDDKPDPEQYLQHNPSSDPDPETARTDPFASLSPADAAFGREVLERCRQAWGAPGFGDVDDLDAEEDVEDDALG